MMLELVEYTVIASTPLISGLLVWLYFIRLRMHRRRSHVFLRLIVGNALVLLLLLSILMVIGESYFRFWYDTTDASNQTKTSIRWFRRHWHANESGIRDNAARYEKFIPAGKRRVTFIGDSFTAGHGIKRVEDRFANITRRARPDWDVHLMAECDWDTDAHLKLIERYASYYELDTVVVVANLNDILDILPRWHALRRKLWTGKQPNLFLRHSYLFNQLYYRWQNATDEQALSYYQIIFDGYAGESWSTQQQRLGALHEMVKARGGRLVVVTFPLLHALGSEGTFRSVHTRLGELWDRLNVPNLDLLTVFEAYHPETVTVNRYDPHPNELAHSTAAKAIVAFLDSVMGQSRQPTD